MQPEYSEDRWWINDVDEEEDDEEDDEDDEEEEEKADEEEEDDGEDEELPDVILLVQCNQCLSLSQLLAAPESKIDDVPREVVDEAEDDMDNLVPQGWY